MKSLSVVNESIRSELYLEDDVFSSSQEIYTSEQLSKKIRTLIPIEDLRRTGSFFTGDVLANKAVSTIKNTVDKNSLFFDPTCGVGNLLIAASTLLPIYKSLDKTISYWGKRLSGFDLHTEFVECTKLRLIQSAILRGSTETKLTLNELELLLDQIRVGNIQKNLVESKSATHILLNPPYTLGALDSERSWSSGKVNLAAVIVDDVIANSSENTHFAAILPEVLRCGSRYERWRAKVYEGIDHSIRVIGRFDRDTDVDVFLLSGITGSKRVNNHEPNLDGSSKFTLSDSFKVCVGPLVAYRDKEEGEVCSYIHSKMLPKWKEVEIFETRRTKSRLIAPPFIVINRTSSPSDISRAKATIIKGKTPIAVENHLIVLQPIKGGLRACRKLMSHLKKGSVDQFLNHRMRCRHLTVSAVKEIPYEG